MNWAFLDLGQGGEPKLPHADDLMMLYGMTPAFITCSLFMVYGGPRGKALP